MGTIAENQAAAELRLAALEARVSKLEGEQADDLTVEEAEQLQAPVVPTATIPLPSKE